MSTLADLEAPIAVCYLHQAGDERNRCWLTERHLVVQFRGKNHAFARTILKTVAIETRRAWLPLIAGGIAAPLSLLALFLNIYDPWILIYVFLPALLLLYLGWLPYTVLAVHDAVKPRDFRLPAVSANLRAFVRFTNRMILQGNDLMYHVARAEDWSAAAISGHYAPASLAHEGFIHASQADQLERLKKSGIFTTDVAWVVLAVDPLKVQAEIRYEPGLDPPGASTRGASTRESTSPPSELFPHIYGPLNVDAVVSINPL